MSMIERAIILLAIFLLSFAISLFFISNITGTKKRVRFRLAKPNRPRSFLIFPSLSEISQSKYAKLFHEILERLKTFSSPKKQLQQEDYKKKFITAGIKSNVWMTRFFGLKTFFTFIVPIIYILFGFFFSKDTSATDMFMVAVTLAVAGYYLPNAVLASKVKKRKQEIFDAFPDSLDLIRVCVAAGMGLDAAISRVGSEISVQSKAMSEEFTQLNLELRAGLTRSVALQNFAIRCDLDEVKAFVGMLIQAERHGTSVNEALIIFSEDLRSKRKLLAQEIASKIPVKLSLPILLCIFPAIFVILLAPPIVNVTGMFK